MKSHFEYDRRYMPSAPVVPITVDGYSENTDPITVSALVDSGADGTMLPMRILERVGASFVDTVQMSGVTGIQQPRDRYRVRIKIGEFKIKGVDAIAVASNGEAIAGRLGQ
ncbi:MAG: aspartyl protease family protein [Chloroflexota bacterium]